MSRYTFAVSLIERMISGLGDVGIQPTRVTLDRYQHRGGIYWSSSVTSF